jgi:hypothetical protein
MWILLFGLELLRVLASIGGVLLMIVVKYPWNVDIKNEKVSWN